MSRHIIVGENAPLEIVLGWDPPLQTFFVQVHDLSKDEEEEIVLWGGTTPGEIPHERVLENVVGEYNVTIPEEMLIALRKDKEENRA